MLDFDTVPPHWQLSDSLFRRAEKFYDPVPVLEWMRAHSWVPIAACVLYGALILAGQSYFATRPRLNWRFTMAAWNLFLATFSFIGMIRVAPQLLHNLTTMSIRDNLCSEPQMTYGSGSSGLWTQLFVLSKFP